MLGVLKKKLPRKYAMKGSKTLVKGTHSVLERCNYVPWQKCDFKWYLKLRLSVEKNKSWPVSSTECFLRIPSVCSLVTKQWIKVRWPSCWQLQKLFFLKSCSLIPDSRQTSISSCFNQHLKTLTRICGLVDLILRTNLLFFKCQLSKISCLEQ